MESGDPPPPPRDHRSRLYNLIMSNTLGYHIVVSGYGLWLPGDARGSWSEAWDEQIGFHQPHTLHPGDPARHRIATERMRYPAVRLSEEMMRIWADVLRDCARSSPWNLAALSIEPTHTHLLITASTRGVDGTIKWLKDRTTKAIHTQTHHQGPVWCKGSWRSYLFDTTTWINTRDYIESHNVRRGLVPRPYDFVASLPV